MRTFDFTPYRRTTVGFDRLFDFLETASRGEAGGDNYPPFDIEKAGDDRYAITLAVAGFRPEDIEVTQNQNILLIKGKRSGGDENRQMIHAGIATRAFERRFELADFVRVEKADLKDGLLRIELVREVPEAMKPRTIQVGSSQTQTSGQAQAGGQQIEGASRTTDAAELRLEMAA